MATATSNMPELEPGLYYDCARGRYIGEAVQQLAQEYGWTAEYCDSDGEFYYDAWDDAERFLQDFAPDGFYCGTHDDDGSWGVWRIADDE